MWIISASGFVSIVQDRKDASKVWIRARVKEDIAQMFPAQADEIVTKPGADYVFRLIVPREVASMAMWNAVADVDYTSHAKEEMNRRSHPNPKRMSAYYKIWNALADLQPFAPYSRVPRVVGGVAPRSTAPVHTFSDGAFQPPLPGTTRPATSTSHYDWDKHPQSKTYVGGKEVDLINGEDLDAEWTDAPDEVFALEDDEFAAYVDQRENERTGPAGPRAKRTRKLRNPRRRAAKK
jgi:hypothetical protein